MQEHSSDWRRSDGLLRRYNPFSRAYARLLLSRAKHGSLTGHPRIAGQLARLPRAYSYSLDEAVGIDGAAHSVQETRLRAFAALSESLRAKSPQTHRLAGELRQQLSDAQFVDHYRVPFQFRDIARTHLPVATMVDSTDGNAIRDIDGNWSLDLGGSYGVNLFGTEFYKECMQRAVARASDVGLLLGPHHPLVADNTRRICTLSGMDEVSFHMSGTEAVMQAVRLARFHTRRSHIVRFAGAYHGWWDGVQAGPGNPRPPHEVYTLEEMSDTTLEVLRTRDDIACVLVNPIQAMHPNSAPPSDATLIGGNRHARFNREAYAAWLAKLRKVCTARKIVLILDEVFLGFRVARGGAQEYFGVEADLVTYGKSLGGGFPVGVVAGKRSLMRRFNADRPGDVCLARGTFNAHPYVMAAMNEFLMHVDTPAVREHYESLDAVWNARANSLNERLRQIDVPIRVVNMTSIWCVTFQSAGRFNWLLQYYLRDEGLSMSWIGTGRFIFSHDLTDAQVSTIGDRFVRAAERMQRDGWLWVDNTNDSRNLKREVAFEVLRSSVRRTPAASPVPVLLPHASSDRSTLP